MTLSTTTNKTISTGNGSTTVFNFAFKVFSDTKDDDVAVYVTDSTSGVITKKVVSTDYTVTVNESNNTGTVTFTTAPLSGDTVTVAREVSVIQETAIPIRGSFSSESIEKEIDRSRMIDQQLEEKIDRAILMPQDTTASAPTFPDSGSGFMFMDGDDISFVTGISVGVLPAQSFGEDMLNTGTKESAQDLIGCFSLATGDSLHAATGENFPIVLDDDQYLDPSTGLSKSHNPPKNITVGDFGSFTDYSTSVQYAGLSAGMKDFHIFLEASFGSLSVGEHINMTFSKQASTGFDERGDGFDITNLTDTTYEFHPGTSVEFRDGNGDTISSALMDPYESGYVISLEDDKYQVV